MAFFHNGRRQWRNSCFDVVSHAGATALGLEGYGIAVGARADFVVLRAERVPEAVVAVPKDRTVYRAGREVARGGKVAA